jgi:hypothetical protein
VENITGIYKEFLKLSKFWTIVILTPCRASVKSKEKSLYKTLPHVKCFYIFKAQKTGVPDKILSCCRFLY